MDFLDDEPTPEERQAALIAALKARMGGQIQPQQGPSEADFSRGWGNMNLRSGDRVLSNLGQSQIQQAGQMASMGQQAKMAGLAQALQAQREKTRRAQELSDTSSQRRYQESRDDKRFQNELEQARIMAGQKTEERGAKIEEERKKVSVPGYEIDPEAAPTADDAKKLKASVASAQKVRKLVQELRRLHTGTKEKPGVGTELFGPDAERMGQLSTAIQLEAKNIAELGALSGPDMDLMKRLSGADPSSFGANLKGAFGSDNTATSLKGLEDWVDGTVTATAGAGGYRPAARPKGGDFSLDGPTVVEERETPDGRTVQLLSDGTKRLKQ
jgi:hypothetical protein